MSTKMSLIFTNNKIIFYGFLLRMGLLLFGDIQDYYAKVKYTDLDYAVYTDAAKYVMEGKSPYDRHTYRYTPLLAYLMIPTQKYFLSFGKYLFSFSDILCGVVLKKLLEMTITKDTSKITKLLAMWYFNPLPIIVGTRGNADTLISLMVLMVLLLILKK